MTELHRSLSGARCNAATACPDRRRKQLWGCVREQERGRRELPTAFSAKLGKDMHEPGGGEDDREKETKTHKFA